MLLNLSYPFRIPNEVFKASLTSSIFSWTSDPSEPPTALNRMTLTQKSMRIQISSLSLRSRVMQHSHRGCVMCRRCSCPGVASDCHTHTQFIVLSSSQFWLKWHEMSNNNNSNAHYFHLAGSPGSCPLPNAHVPPSPLTIVDLRKLLCFSQQTQTINKLKNAAQKIKPTQIHTHIYIAYTYIL